MKLATQETHAIVGGVMQTAQMTMLLNAEAFRMAFDGIYSDKITAPFRELVTNARDGNAAVGKDTDEIDIHLPSPFDHTFWVRDYGCSMDHQFMMTRYTAIMDSTKRDDNDAVGAFGIGRISPLSYTSTFTVTCWKDGIENVYSVFIGESGFPTVAHLAARPSTEPTGVKVTYPVKDHDVQRFRNAAQAVLFGFEKLPRIVNEAYEQRVPAVLSKGKNWTIYSQENSPLRKGVYAKQGCVLYPMDLRELRDLLGFDVPQHLVMVIDFPIGEVTPVRSREGLSYDEHTKANIKLAMSTICTEVAESISADLAAEPTYFDACRKWRLMCNARYDSSEKAVVQLAGALHGALALMWNDVPIRTEFTARNATFVTPGMFFSSGNPLLGQEVKTLSFKSPEGYGKSTYLAISDLEKLTVWIEDSDLKFGPSRMRRVLQDTPAGSRNLLWVRPNHSTDVDELKKALPFVPFNDLSTIEPIKTKRDPNATKNQTVKLRYFVAGSSYSSKTYADFDEITPDADTLFIEQRENGFKDHRGIWETQDCLAQSLKTLVNADVLGQGTRVYCLTEAAEKRVTKLVKKPRMLHTWAKEQVEKAFNVATLKINPSDYELTRNHNIANALRESGVTLWGELAKFEEDYRDDPKVQALTSYQRDVITTYFPQVVQRVDKAAHANKRHALLKDLPIVSLIVERTYDTKESGKLLSQYLPLIQPSK